MEVNNTCRAHWGMEGTWEWEFISNGSSAKEVSSKGLETLASLLPQLGGCGDVDGCFCTSQREKASRVDRHNPVRQLEKA